LRAVHAQQRENHDGVGAVVLCAGRREGFAETCTGGRMHRIDGQPRILQQRVQERVAPGLDGQRHGFALVSVAELFQPGVQRFGRRLDATLFNAIRAGDLPGKRMCLITPIQGHEGRIVFVFHGGFRCGETGCSSYRVRREVTPVAEYAWPFLMPSERRRLFG